MELNKLLGKWINDPFNHIRIMDFILGCDEFTEGAGCRTATESGVLPWFASVVPRAVPRLPSQYDGYDRYNAGGSQGTAGDWPCNAT